jgi:hypothetical protein
MIRLIEYFWMLLHHSKTNSTIAYSTSINMPDNEETQTAEVDGSGFTRQPNNLMTVLPIISGFTLFYLKR